MGSAARAPTERVASAPAAQANAGSALTAKAAQKLSPAPVLSIALADSKRKPLDYQEPYDHVPDMEEFFELNPR